MNTLKRTLLYYPSIIIENPSWIRQSILYWDEIGSIVPLEFNYDRVFDKSYDMQILRREGLYKAYCPEDFDLENSNLIDEFMYLVSTGNISPYPDNSTDLSWLFASKFYDIHAIRVLPFAIQKANKVFMKKQLVLLYMSLFAKYLANADQESIVSPGTDSTINLQLAFPSTSSENFPGLNLSLYNVLPTPRENVQVADIIKFKSRRRDELLQLRQIIYEQQDKIKQAKELGEVRELNARFAERLQIEVSNLCKAFDGDRLPYLWGTLKNIFVAESPAINAFVTNAPEAIKLTATIGGIAFAGLLSLSEYFLDHRNRQAERLTANSYSYLYLAKQEGII